MERLLECALDIFLEHGFEQTKMLDIAKAAGTSKRTIYAHFEDKEAVFRAAVHRAIERFTVPLETLQAAETDNLEATLKEVARIRIKNVATPTGTKLQRILYAQSYRFPDLFDAAYERGTIPAIQFLSDLFTRHNAKGTIDIRDPQRAAVDFLSLVVGGPARLITSGHPLDETEIEKRIDFSVLLFLNGVRPR